MDFPRTANPPLRFVTVAPKGERRLQADPPSRILVHTVHDGEVIPPAFLEDQDGSPRVDRALLEQKFIEMRDWGANRVARHLAGAMGLEGYGRVEIARVLLDFNRFPGTTARNARQALDHFSIGPPFDEALRHKEKMALLNVYDAMSDQIEGLVDGSLISIAIHTYDPHNPSETKRPDVSIVATPSTYQRESRMPDRVFDPIYPALLAESTCSRMLRDRISLNLERNGYRVSHNQPYPLPEGSIEVRAQVWSFFRTLKQRFEQERPDTKDRDDFRLVWAMLLNTNLRSQEGDTLSGYLHRYRRPAPNQIEAFEAARDAYSVVRTYLETSSVLSDYRRSPHRPSALAIEVRKDLLVTFDDNGHPLGCSPEQDATAARIAEVIAGAVEIFLSTDREELRRVKQQR